MRRLPIVPHDDRPTHPRYGKALGGQPYDVDGVVFWPFRYGIGRYVRATTDGRISIFDTTPGGDATAYVDGVFIPSPADGRKPRRFRLFERAAQAAIALRKEKGPHVEG